MRFKTVVLFSFLGCSLYLAAQDSYDLMLKTLYSHTVPVITPSQVVKSPGIMVLDTRSRKEYEVSHIYGAEWINFDSPDLKFLEELPRNTKIVTYCTVGWRSEKIGEKIQAMGFNNVYNLYGGIIQWVNEDHEVVDNTGKVTNNVHVYGPTWGIWLKKGVKIYE